MSEPLHDQLAAVRQAHPTLTCAIHGHCWNCLDAGSGEAVLLLPGALGQADTSFQTILALRETQRVVSVGYPATIQRLTALLDGLAVLLQRLGITQAHVVGGSYSGLAAQYFAVRWPRRVRSLLLSNTGAPGETLAMRWGLAASGVQLLPERLLQGAMQWSIRRFLPQPSPEQDFWRSYFAASLPDWRKEAIAARLRLTGEMQSRANAGYLCRSPYRGPVLIIDAESDRLVTPRRRQALRNLYPQAQHAAIAGRGHAASLDEAQAYIRIYREFLCSLAVFSAV